VAMTSMIAAATFQCKQPAASSSFVTAAALMLTQRSAPTRLYRRSLIEPRKIRPIEPTNCEGAITTADGTAMCASSSTCFLG
jgi:hypothetical protein